MSTEVVYKLFVKSVSGRWKQVGYDYGCMPFLFESTLQRAKAHYESLGLKTKVENTTMEFDDR